MSFLFALCISFTPPMQKLTRFFYSNLMKIMSDERKTATTFIPNRNEKPFGAIELWTFAQGSAYTIFAFSYMYTNKNQFRIRFVPFCSFQLTIFPKIVFPSFSKIKSIETIVTKPNPYSPFTFFTRYSNSDEQMKRNWKKCLFIVRFQFSIFVSIYAVGEDCT